MGMSSYFRDLRERIGDRLIIAPGVAAIIRDEEGRLLLHQRSDGGWNLPGGAIEPGETPATAIVREIAEETGLRATPVQILAVLGGDAFRVFYRNGDAVEYCVTVFECAVVGREARFEPNEESIAVRYFAEADVPALGLPFSRELLFGKVERPQFDPPRERIPRPKKIVESGYDSCADRYSMSRVGGSKHELSLLAERLVPPCRSLDIGCGSGVPVTARLAEFGPVTGVDISGGQIELARAHVPSATLVHGDIMEQRFGADTFDAVTMFYTLFHLPRAEQRELLRRVAEWLRPGGYLLATLARTDDPGYTEPDFFGVTMYWSHFVADWYADQLDRLGFDVIHSGTTGHGYRADLDLPPESHPFVLARRRQSGIDGARETARPWLVVGPTGKQRGQ